MAGPTRFELATSGVTGRRSNQLNYDPAYGRFVCRNYSPARKLSLQGLPGQGPASVTLDLNSKLRPKSLARRYRSASSPSGQEQEKMVG